MAASYTKILNWCQKNKLEIHEDINFILLARKKNANERRKINLEIEIEI